MKYACIFLLLVCFHLKSFGHVSILSNNHSVENDTPIHYDLESSMTNYVMRLSPIEVKKSSTDFIKFNVLQKKLSNEGNTNPSINSLTTPIIKQINNKKNTDDRLKIRLEIHTSNNFNREILLTIDKRATDNFDRGFDAVLSEDFPNDMYWMLDENKLIIQAMNELPKEKVVPIGIISDGKCSIQIKVASIANPYEGMEVYLRDNDTMETFDIKNGTFDATLEEGQFNDKYAIVFEPKVEPPIEENAIFNKAHFFIGGQNRSLSIRKPEGMTINNISLFNVIGQQIHIWNDNLNANEMDLPIHFKKGVYILHIETSKGSYQKKLIMR